MISYTGEFCERLVTPATSPGFESLRSMKRAVNVPYLWAPVLVIWVLVSVSALARNWQWRDLTPPAGTVPTPSARALGSAIYDPIGQRVIIFGGRGASGFLNDLWSFDLTSRTWVEVNAQGTPPAPRRGHNAIYDPVGHQMVVWAGEGSQFHNDTWTLDLTMLQWKNVSPADSPTARYGSASVYDPVVNVGREVKHV